MNQGVEILLSRMDSNPEEFVGLSGPGKAKWGWVLSGMKDRISGEPSGLPFLNDEEVQALWDKYGLICRDWFTRKVLETLLPEKEELSSFFGARQPTKIFTSAQYATDAAKLLEQSFKGAYDEAFGHSTMKTTGRYNLDGDLT